VRRWRRTLVERWRAGGGNPWVDGVLSALSTLFGWGVRLRNLLYDHRLLPSRRGPIPVIGVGNLAVGGTGKTPVSGWLISLLRAAGRRPALVARGYGRDELLLHREWNPDVPIIASPDRLRGVRQAAREGADVVVLDDGFQHRRLQRDFDVVLLSPSHPLPPRLLPAGPWREGLDALRRADLILMTVRDQEERLQSRELLHFLRGLPGLPPLYTLPLVPGDWRTLEGGHGESPPSSPPLVVASIALPEVFERMVRVRCERIAGSWFLGDHAEYGASELAELRGRVPPGGWIATTEKDAVKLREVAAGLPPVWVLPLEVSPGPELLDVLRELLSHHLGEIR